MATAAVPLIGSMILQGFSQYQQGKQNKAEAGFVANQLNQNANLANQAAIEQEAAGQRKSNEALRRNRYLSSQFITNALANGGSSNQKNIADQLSDLGAQGDYEALSDLYEGNSRADALRNEGIGFRNKATGLEFQGKQAYKAGQINTLSSIGSSAIKGYSFYNKYNNPAPTDSSLYNYSNSYD